MILEKAEPEEHQYAFLIRPNRSMTARGMMVFVCFVGLAVFLTAMRFVLLGAWIVLPFAILEIGLLAAGFWLYERASRYRELVKISSDNLEVTQESVRSHRTWRFNPHWVKVTLRLDPENWYPSRLFIGSHGEQVEIGACLTNQEREELSKVLKRSIPQAIS
jgi:uncharacterized membrane protein